MPLGERHPAAQIHHPLARGQPPGYLLGVGRVGRGQIQRGRSRGIGRAHVCVVRGDVVQRGEQLRDEGVHVLDQRVVPPAFVADRRGRPLGLRGRTEAAEAVRGQHGHGVRELIGEPVRGGVLGAGQSGGEPGLHQVGPAHTADQQRATGEDGHVPALFRQYVRGVVRGVPGGGERPQREAVVDRGQVAVRDRDPGEGDLRGGGHQVARPGDARQIQAARHVVVVQMGLHHQGDPHAAPGGSGDDPVDVARRVHDRGGPPPARQIAAVAEARGLDGVHEEHDRSPSVLLYPGGICDSG